MLCLNLMVFLLGDILRNAVAVNCSELPTTTTDIQPALKNLVANSVGEDLDKVTVIIVSGPFICLVQGTEVGTYQEVSIIVIFHSNQGHNNAVRQFEMRCVEIDRNISWISVDGSLNTPGVDYTTISLWTNCSDCVISSPPNKNHRQCEFQLFMKHNIKDH